MTGLPCLARAQGQGKANIVKLAVVTACLIDASAACRRNFGAAATLQVSLSATSDQSATSAALLKFDLTGISASQASVLH